MRAGSIFIRWPEVKSPWKKVGLQAAIFVLRSKMRHVQFGRSGLQVSRLCLGTMTFGSQCDEGQSHAILDAASDGGIEFIDTANVYPMRGGPASAGRTEEIVGRWLKGKRHQFIVATKCAGQMGTRP